MHFPPLSGQSPVYAQLPAQPEHAQASSSSQVIAPQPLVPGQTGTSAPDVECAIERFKQATIGRASRSRALHIIPGLQNLIRSSRGADHRQAEGLERFGEEMKSFIQKAETAKSTKQRDFIGLSMKRRMKNFLRPVKCRLDQLEPAKKRELLRDVSLTRMRINSLPNNLPNEDDDQISCLGLLRQGSAKNMGSSIAKVLKELKNVQDELVKTSDFQLVLQAFQDALKAPLIAVESKTGTRRERLQNLEALRLILAGMNDEYLGTLSHEEIGALAKTIDDMRRTVVTLRQDRSLIQEQTVLAGIQQEIDQVIARSSSIMERNETSGDNSLFCVWPRPRTITEGGETSGDNNPTEAHPEASAVLGNSARTLSSRLFEMKLELEDDAESDIASSRFSTATESDLFELSSGMRRDPIQDLEMQRSFLAGMSDEYLETLSQEDIGALAETIADMQRTVVTLSQDGSLNMEQKALEDMQEEIEEAMHRIGMRRLEMDFAGGEGARLSSVMGDDEIESEPDIASRRVSTVSESDLFELPLP